MGILPSSSLHRTVSDSSTCLLAAWNGPGMDGNEGIERAWLQLKEQNLQWTNTCSPEKGRMSSKYWSIEEVLWWATASVRCVEHKKVYGKQIRL